MSENLKKKLILSALLQAHRVFQIRSLISIRKTMVCLLMVIKRTYLTNTEFVLNSHINEITIRILIKNHFVVQSHCCFWNLAYILVQTLLRRSIIS